MNCNIYFFVGNQKGYSQYPDNYSKKIISNIVAQLDNRDNISQLAISANGRLAYITYVYRYSSSHYFGLCCEYNEFVPTNFKYLFTFFTFHWWLLLLALEIVAKFKRFEVEVKEFLRYGFGDYLFPHFLFDVHCCRQNTD